MSNIPKNLLNCQSITGIKIKICLICSIGRLSPEKGIYELVDAFMTLILNNNLRLLIIGEGRRK